MLIREKCLVCGCSSSYMTRHHVLRTFSACWPCHDGIHKDGSVPLARQVELAVLQGVAKILTRGESSPLPFEVDMMLFEGKANDLQVNRKFLFPVRPGYFNRQRIVGEWINRQFSNKRLYRIFENIKWRIRVQSGYLGSEGVVPWQLPQGA